MDDDSCSAYDMAALKKLCVGRASCTTCWWCRPNSGYDVPYCFKRTSLGQGKGSSRVISYNPPCGSKEIPWNTPPYKLKRGNIPKKCKYWRSHKKEYQRLVVGPTNLRQAQEAINKLPPAARKKLKI